MTQPFRTAQGGAVDRGRTLRFTFDGRAYTGHPGDTLASALLANGVRVAGRSFKYHRPRGVFGAGVEEPNVLVQLGTGARTEPNLKATQVELTDGLTARAVNCWPSARFDLLGFIRFLKPFMPSGFYYKTFIWPSWAWFERFIRAAAGLGTAPRAPDPDRYDKRHASVDVLVVGGGRAGVAAAVEAARAGRRVLLVHDQADTAALPVDAPAALEVLRRCTAFGYHDHDHVLAVERPLDAPVRQRLWHIRAREVALATGALERPLVFPRNDRPGVMLASAAQQYLQRHGVLPGRAIVLATNNDSAYAVAAELHAAGARIVAILDARPDPAGAALDQARALGIRIEAGAAPTDTRGSGVFRAALAGVEWHRLDGAAALPGSGAWLEADALLLSGGWNPTVHLFSQAGGGLAFDDKLQAFVPARPAPEGQHVRCVGAAAGQVEGVARVHALWSVDVSRLGRTAAYAWVDFASDVTEGDLRLAVRENFAAVEHLKRYTTTGMMSDQGKTSNVNAIGILGSITGRAPQDVGTTKFRPPFDPVTFGAIAGRQVGPFYQPLRRLPTHALQEAARAKLEDYGGWARPAHYARAGEAESAAIAREVRAVRTGVGIIDYSPLGKITVRGPDAGTLLHRMYVNNMQTLKPGACRYGLMIGEDGIVFDDGVCTRWDELTWQVGTTSGHAERVGEWLEEWLQCEWVDLDVVVEPVTTQWAVVMVAGPQARALLQRLDTGIDLAAAAFPHMTAREGRFDGAPLRIMRVSFTGELSYEVSVPWNRGAALWQRLLGAGRDLDVTPFGIEALMVMRIEKGFLHVGTETDGSTMPQDVGFAGIIAKKPDDFVGRRSTMTPEGRRADRLQLVGLECAELLPPGAHVVPDDFTQVPALTHGWVTSSVASPTLGRPVALGMVARGASRHGETVKVHDALTQRTFAAKIVAPGAYDPQGERLNG